MASKSLEGRKTAEVAEAIRRAKEYAAEQGVPLTAERLAAELEMDLEEFHRVVRGISHPGSGKAALIRAAYGEATASVMEHAMKRGTSPNMHILYLKNNAGYDRDDRDGEEESTQHPVVVFVGEEAILD